MATYPWFPFYAEDFLGDTRILKLTDVQQAVLVRLWCVSWIERGLENDLDVLCRQVRATPADVNLLLRTFYELDEASGRWLSERQEEKRAEAEARTTHAQTAARARWRP